MIAAIYAQVTPTKQPENCGGVLEVTDRVGSLGPRSIVAAWTFNERDARNCGRNSHE